MAKEIKKSFAERAQDIMKRYPRASYDRLSKQAMEAELDNLSKEQEAYKQERGIQDPQDQVQEMKYGGRIKFGKGTKEVNPEFTDIKANYLPLVGSAAVAIAGNRNLEKRNKEREKETYNVVPVTPKLFDYSEERRGLEEGRRRASTTMQNRVKTSARTRGELLENQNTGQAEIEAGYNDAMRKSYAGEQNANVDIQNRTSLYNSQLLSKLNADRHADKRALQLEQDAYRSAALSIIPQASRDYTATKMDYDKLKTSGQEYKWMKDKDGNWTRVFKDPETGKLIKDTNKTR